MGNISKGWLLLYDSDEITPTNKKSKTNDLEQSNNVKTPMNIAIDHVFDLQHNNDTVFNKLKEYLKDYSYSWIDSSLEYKANVESYFELLHKCSPEIRQMASPILYNKLGQTWEKEIKDKNPEINLNDYKDEYMYSTDLEKLKRGVPLLYKGGENISTMTDNKIYRLAADYKETDKIGRSNSKLLVKDDRGNPIKIDYRNFNILDEKSSDSDIASKNDDKIDYTEIGKSIDSDKKTREPDETTEEYILKHYEIIDPNELLNDGGKIQLKIGDVLKFETTQSYYKLLKIVHSVGTDNIFLDLKSFDNDAIYRNHHMQTINFMSNGITKVYRKIDPRNKNRRPQPKFKNNDILDYTMNGNIKTVKVKGIYDTKSKSNKDRFKYDLEVVGDTYHGTKIPMYMYDVPEYNLSHVQI